MSVPIVNVVNFILNTVDIIIIYYLYCGFTNTKCDFSKKNIIICLVWGALAGLGVGYLRDDVSRFLIYLSDIICIYLLSRKKIFNVLMILVLIFICMYPLQLIVSLLLFPFSINATISLLIAQLISLSAIKVICNNFQIYKLLYILERELILTLFFFISIGVIFGISLYLNFEVNTLYSVYYIIIIIISLAGICKTVKRLYFYTNKLPLIRHEMENALAGIYLSANNTDNIDSVRKSINEYLRVLGINPSHQNMHSDTKNKIIYDFIQYKNQEKSGWKKLHYDMEIHYHESHARVSEPAMIIMLGILLDNAIQMSGNGKTIKINIRITKEYLSIQVANELLHQMEQDFMKIFEKGYSTKKQDSEIHGYGLAKLSEIVNGYGGEILIKEEYLKEEGADFIFIITEFK